MSIYKNKVLYECGEAQFHKNVFVAHLLSHIFPPFALLLLSERQRKVHGFVYCYENPVIFYVTYVFVIAVIILLVCYAFAANELQASCFIPLVCFFIHRSMVALKYATMSPCEYEKYICATVEDNTKYAVQTQIITGLLSGSSELIGYEIAAGATRVGIQLHNMFLFFPKYKNPVRTDTRRLLTKYLWSDGSTIGEWKLFLEDSLNIDRTGLISRNAEGAKVVDEKSMRQENPIESNRTVDHKEKLHSIKKSAGPEQEACALAHEYEQKASNELQFEIQLQLKQSSDASNRINDHPHNYASVSHARGALISKPIPFSNTHRAPSKRISKKVLNLIDNDNSGYNIGITSIVYALVRRANNSYMHVVQFILKIAMVSNALVAILPWLPLFDMETNRIDIVSIAFLVLNSILSFLLFGLVLQFFTGVILDILRRRSFARKLSAMITEPNRYECNLYRVFEGLSAHSTCNYNFEVDALHENKYVPEVLFKTRMRNRVKLDQNLGDGSVESDVKYTNLNAEKPPPAVPMPQLSMDMPSNATVFYYVRSILQRFGYRMRNRLDVYMGDMLLFCAVILIVQVIRITIVEDPVREINSVIFRQCIVFVCTIVTLVTIIVTVGADVNSTFNAHRQRVMTHIARVRHRMNVCGVIISRIHLQIMKEQESLLDCDLKSNQTASSADIDSDDDIDSEDLDDNITVTESIVQPRIYQSSAYDTRSNDSISSTINPIADAKISAFYNNFQSTDANTITEEILTMCTKSNQDCTEAERVAARVAYLHCRIQQIETLIKTDSNLCDSLVLVKDSIEVDNQEEMCKIFGIDHSYELAYSIFTGVMSVYIFVFTTAFGLNSTA